MGVDCRILLPAAARLRDVADVLAALAGTPNQKHPFSNGDGFSVHNPAARVGRYDGPGLEECAKIEFDAPLFGNGASGYTMYHFEGGPNGERLLMPRSHAEWIAIGKGLVDFFGGTVDYADCDDSTNDYSQPQRADIHAEDGDEWHALQLRKLAVEPITKKQVDECRKVAAYK